VRTHIVQPREHPHALVPVLEIGAELDLEGWLAAAAEGLAVCFNQGFASRVSGSAATKAQGVFTFEVEGCSTSAVGEPVC